MQKTIKLGDFIEHIIAGINDNFADLDLRKAGTADIPSKTSQLANDSGYQTAQQVAAAVSALADSAPELLDTLNELAAALGNDPNFAATITAMIGEKVDKIEGKGLSANDFTDALLEKLNRLQNGTSTTRIDFTAADARWGTLTDGKYTLTVASGGKSPLNVCRKNGAAYGVVLCDIATEGADICVTAYDKFDGYLLMI